VSFKLIIHAYDEHALGARENHALLAFLALDHESHVEAEVEAELELTYLV
tara:strand:- start:157 stop:306 length:150 start_codon:yes stop_codon:yes gene_type:complete